MTIEHMEMDDRMQQMGTAMALPTGCGANDLSRLIDYRENFLLIVLHVYK